MIFIFFRAFILKPMHKLAIDDSVVSIERIKRFVTQKEYRKLGYIAIE